MPFNIKYSPKLLIGLLIVLFFGIALFIRIYYPYDQVFVGDWIKYTNNDAYYQMRLVDNMAYNFPHITAFDPYLIYPGGAAYGGLNFFNYLLAFIVWIGTAGAPTQHAIDLFGLYFPVVLAALTIIPAYFIGKALFNRWAGVIAAGLMAVLPGEFIGRSILGGMDKPVAETLFTAVAAMFVIFAVRSGWQSKLSWSHIAKFDWKAFLKPLLYSLLGGLFLGAYLITWAGALLFVFIFAAYFIIQLIVDHLKGESSFYLGFTGFFLFLVALLIYQPVAGGAYQTVALVIALLIPPALTAVSAAMARWRLKTYYYPVALVVIAGVFLAAFHFIKPDLLNTMFAQFSIFNPGGPSGTTTIEMQPFLSPQGTFTTQVAWGNFTTSFFLVPWWPVPGIALISLFILIWTFTRQQSDTKPMLSLRISSLIALALAIILLFAWSTQSATALLALTLIAGLAFFILLFRLAIKQRSEDKHLLFFLIWTLIILIATLTQRRFAYYLVVNIALLSAYLGWQFIRLAVQWRRDQQAPETLQEQYRRSRLIGIVGGIAIFIASFFIVDTKNFFVPVFVLAYLSILYGFWAWVRLKGKNDYMMLWAFVFPIGIPILAFSENEAIKAKIKDKTPGKTNPWLYRFSTATLILVVFMGMFYTNYTKSRDIASVVTYASSNAWEEALHWLKDNTPEPLPSESYYELYNRSSFAYPDTAYGVTSWWDYGYWIMRTARRLPSTNPSQSATPIKRVANLFLSQDEEQSRELMAQLDSSYVVLDNTLTSTKLWAIATWAGRDQNAYINTYYVASKNQLVPVQIFTQEYYKLLSVRLYNFDGKASTSEKPLVITYENRTQSGISYRLITAAEEFNSYLEAQNYVLTEQKENMLIVGSTPYVNPVPIEAVTDFSLVFSSTMNSASAQQDGVPEVKIFQYLGN